MPKNRRKRGARKNCSSDAEDSRRLMRLMDELKGRPDKKPDADNILKAVLDALNGVAYEDDRQVVEVLCIKKYIGGDGWKSYGMEPGLYIGIGMLGGSEHAE